MEQVLDIFARAGRVKSDQYLTEDERRNDLAISGIRTFKRRVLGLCRSSKVKQIDELSDLLKVIGVAKSVEEAHHILYKITDVRLPFGTIFGTRDGRPISSGYVLVEEVDNRKGNIADRIKSYRITAASYE